MSYVALVLTEKSREILLSFISEMIPENWEIIAHHVTIHMGTLTLEEVQNSGNEYKVTIDSFAKNDKVVAVGVMLPDNIKSINKKPHITIAIDRLNGAKPVMSNFLSNWTKIEKITLITILEQC